MEEKVLSGEEAHAVSGGAGQEEEGRDPQSADPAGPQEGGTDRR